MCKKTQLLSIQGMSIFELETITITILNTQESASQRKQFLPENVENKVILEIKLA